MAFFPCLAKKSSTDFNALLEVSFTTASRPRILAIQKQTAAPTMAELQERMAPCHQPKRFALAKVIRKAGRGAAMD